ncbi:MAG: M24 family metallopeptidase [Alphaproteobacteria bacterium]|nr:M24 family metallopeptidase [Alphaproteobacteria bacterium]
MLEKIRAYLVQNGLDAVLVPHQDEFLGEYLTADKKRLKALTGFSGSAGLAVITTEQAVLFVDSRYTIQAKRQTRFDVIEVPTETTPLKWISENLKGKKIAFNGDVHSAASILSMQSKTKEHKIKWVNLADNIVDMFWLNRPEPAEMKPTEYDETYAGRSAEDKIASIASEIAMAGFDAMLVADPESVSWLINRRDLQNPECPIYYDRAIVYATGKCEQVTEKSLKTLSKKKVMSDFNRLPYSLYEKLAKALTDKSDIIATMKSQKNAIEIQNLRQACLYESAVICKFLAFVEQQKETITELDCVKELHGLRAQNPLYVADSFDVIAASGPHAAQAHYLPTPSTSCFVRKYPLLLVDTGGQYLNGTTDMTRTICIGKPTPLTKKRYTQVLKGHIALASAQISEGDTPAELDKLAHQFLRADGVDYLHATGHGIGMFLSVHENPPVIHEKSTTPLYAGMVFSNEPAVYDEANGFGIRLENMLLSVPAENGQLKFENLLFIPFDGRMVDFDMLTADEKAWLKVYHEKIVSDVFPMIGANVKAVLKPLIDTFIQNG